MIVLIQFFFSFLKIEISEDRTPSNKRSYIIYRILYTVYFQQTIVYYSKMILYYSKIVYLTSWMIVPPFRNWFGSVRSEIFTNRSFHIPNQIISHLNLVPLYHFVPVQLFRSVRSSMTVPFVNTIMVKGSEICQTLDEWS